MINRILVPLDGSKLAEQALSAARGLAVATDGELVLLTAIARMERWANAETPAWEEEEEAMAAGYLDTLARELRDAGLKVTTRVAWGRPSEMIRQIADEASADLIVMTTHGRSGIARWLIGSVADNVLRTTQRPLLLVRAQEERLAPLNVRSILVPLDGSRLAESSLTFVKGLARQLSARVILERVIVPPTMLYAEQYIPSSAPILEDLEADARNYLETERERVESEDINVMISVDDGFPVETIINAAERFGADVIVLTSHGRTGPARTILGSVTDGLVRQSNRPCLVIPARAAVIHEKEVHAPSVLGIEPAPTVIPPPVLTEVALAGPPRAKAPDVRPHRPEGITKRKA
jgi:nucleotide-binding universal stress UspA family protein